MCTQCGRKMEVEDDGRTWCFRCALRAISEAEQRILDNIEGKK